MQKQIECESCGTPLFALNSREPQPVGREKCPNCGGTDFSFLE